MKTWDRIKEGWQKYCEACSLKFTGGGRVRPSYISPPPPRKDSEGVTLAEKCFKADEAEDKLYDKLVEIVTGKTVHELLQTNESFGVIDTWTDGYDSSVEMLMAWNCPLDQEKVNKILDLGFGQIYESRYVEDELIGINWTRRGAGKCVPRSFKEDDSVFRKERILEAKLDQANKDLENVRALLKEYCDDEEDFKKWTGEILPNFNAQGDCYDFTTWIQCFHALKEEIEKLRNDAHKV